MIKKQKTTLLLLIIPVFSFAQMFISSSPSVSKNITETEDHLFSFVFQANQLLGVDNMSLYSSLELGGLYHFSRFSVGPFIGVDLYTLTDHGTTEEGVPVLFTLKTLLNINKIDTEFRGAKMYMFASGGVNFIKNINEGSWVYQTNPFDIWSGHNLKIGMGYNISSSFPNTTYEIFYKKQNFFFNSTSTKFDFIGIGISAWFPWAYKKKD